MMKNGIKQVLSKHARLWEGRNVKIDGKPVDHKVYFECDKNGDVFRMALVDGDNEKVIEVDTTTDYVADHDAARLSLEWDPENVEVMNE
jgi:hypothetical protein